MLTDEIQQTYQDYRDIPSGLATNELWMLGRRRAIPGAKPTAYFRPEDFVPEFGPDLGIPLYPHEQTREYNPRPETIASQEYYDFFVASQNRYRHSLWDAGKRKNGANVKPGWRTHDKYLSRAKVREHLRGKEIYGCWGNNLTRWFAIDVDYHGGDINYFLDVLAVISQLPDFFPHARWFYVLNRHGISGLHLVGLLPKPSLLEDIRGDVQKVLAFLEDESLDKLLKYKSEKVKSEDFHPLTGLETYPAANHNFRLPYAADRITVTDEWLNLPGEVHLKQNLVRFMAYVKDKDRQAVPLSQVFEFIKANIRPMPSKQVKIGSKKTTRTGGGNGMGKVQPLKGRHLAFLTGVVLGTEAMPDDTIGSWAAPALRHLILVDGLDPDEALAKIEEFYEMIPDTSFSDRLSAENVSELLRTDAYTARKTADGNLGQERPDESTAIFAKVKAYCDRIGFIFADPSTWHVLKTGKHFSFDISGEDFSLTFEEKLAVKEGGAALLKCDIPSVYQAAHCVKALVTKYPGKELPASLVPHLCARLPIFWHIPSDQGSRCKKAEKFLKLLCNLGVIRVLKPKQWFGANHPDNRATTYGLPKDEAPSDLGRQWFHSTWTRYKPEVVAGGEQEKRSIYFTDFISFNDCEIEAFALEVERLNRPWTPKFHSSG